MKKITCVLLLVFISIFRPAFAAEWAEIDYKTYIDWQSAVFYSNGHKLFWLKVLNPGDWKEENGKKIWFEMQHVEFACGERKVKMIECITYDLNGNVINTYSYPYAEYWGIVPGSTGEKRYLGICNY